MYVYKRQITVYRAIATLVAVSLVLWSVGFHMFLRNAEAANLTNVKNTLSDSAPSSVSNHEFEFLSPTGVANNETITIVFPSQFTGTTSIVIGDVDLLDAGVDQTLVAGTSPGAGQWGYVWNGNGITFTAAADESIIANATITVKIGTNASGGVNQVINPTATTSYLFNLTAGSGVDTGSTRVAIIDNILVTANVATTFEFTISGVSGSGASVNGTSTTGATTNNTIPFGTLTSGNIKTLAQRLNVLTNAGNGYVVTVEEDANLLSSTGADIDNFIDSSATNTPNSWASPTNSIADENTWGHWGLTSEDSDTVGNRTTEFGSNEWIGLTTAPRVVMAHDGPADNATNGIGSTTIGYQIEITALQEAGDDYNTTLTYIATPTF